MRGQVGVGVSDAGMGVGVGEGEGEEVGGVVRGECCGGGCTKDEI